MKKILPALALCIVIAVAGCAMPFGDNGGEQTVGTGYPGVALTSFYPVSQEVNAGGQVTLYLAVQNNGYFRGEDVSVTIFNCGSINQGTLESGAGTIVDSDGDGLYDCNEVIEFGDLDKPDRKLNIPGEIVEEQITFDVPPEGFPEGRSPSTFSARVSYDYMSTASRDVVITTFENYREKGGNLEVGPLTHISDPAPLSVNIIAPTDAVKITEEGELPKFTVSAEIKNMGGGYVKNKELDSVKLCYDSNFVKPVENEDGGDDETTYGDFNQPDGDSGCLSLSSDNSKLTLIGQTNQWRTLSAQFEVLEDSVAVQDIAGFSAELEYPYHTDKTTQITVLKS